MSVTPQVNERLAALTAAGTSVWLDQLRRGMIESGELARMVVEDSLRGVTSNPAIFEKAILGSPDYDADLAEAAREGLSAREIYRRLAVRDVQLAADVLRDVYEETGGHDGYVSLEVAPRLAHDTDGTIEQARMYWGLVDRPNLMIKIPATPAGIPAIETALYEGMNVNVTLLFGVAAYEDVMRAFIRAMERRQADGLPLDRHSVASFFVSRVDTEVDKRLEQLGRADLQGRAGLANARSAYTGLQARLRRRRVRGAAPGRLPGPAPAVGVDRRQEPGLPRDDVRLRPGRPGHRQHDAAPHAAGRRGRRRGVRRDRRRRPDPRPGGAPRRGDRPRRRHRPAPARGHRRVRRADEQAARGDRGQARGDRDRPPDVVRGRPAARARATGRRAAAQGPRGRRGAPDLAPRRHALGAAGHRRAGGPAGLADDRRQGARRPRRDPRVRHRRARRRDDRRGAARDGRLQPRPRGVPPLEPARRGRAAPARARLDGAARRARGRRRDRRRADAVHRLLQVGRDDRAERAARLLPRPAARPGALRRDHRSRHLDARAGHERGLPARVPVGPRDRRALLGALAVRRRAGGARGRRRAGGARGRAGGAGELRAGRGQLRPVARRRARRAGAAGPRQAHVRGRPAAGLVRALGRAARGRVDGQAGPRHPADRRRAARRRVRVRRRPGVPAPARRRRARPGPRGGGPRVRGRRPPDDHGHRRGRERPRPDLLLLRVRHRGGRLGAGDQPVRPAQRPGGQGQHRQGARGGRARGRRRGLARRAARRRWPRRRTSRSSATCPTTTRSTPPWPGCAGR